MKEPARIAPNPIRVLIVDDHEVVRLGLRTLLERFPNIVVAGDAGTAANALAEVERLSPDVVLLDMRLPDASGFVVCREIQKRPVETRVLVLTSFADDETVFEAIEAGADGYLLKEIDGEALITAIERVAAGQSILDPVITGRVMGRVKTAAEPPSRIQLLSAQERRVVALVAEGKTNKEIAGKLGLSDKTVKNYLSNVLDKLHVNRRSQVAALYVQNAGR
ncbi:MAG: response regulator transcription factor [Verrucomicrobia bacterium]|nr:response regulator transcription factor [Verrucomicrobiota bacterium]